MTGRCALVFFLIAGISLVALGLGAQTTIFKWIDTKGNLHVTDRLADVPEPYYGMYRAKLKELEDKRQQSGVGPKIGGVEAASVGAQADAPAPDFSGSFSAKELARRQEWKELVAYWRVELTAATAELETIQNELDQANFNPILRETPTGKGQASEIEARRDLAMKKLETARNMLLSELPTRARREGVSPKWLE